jgi:hypothetical protein
MAPRTTTATTIDAQGAVVGHTTTAIPGQESSVEITTDSKGLAKLSVKVYHEDPAQALTEALRLYAFGTAQLGTWASS